MSSIIESCNLILEMRTQLLKLWMHDEMKFVTVVGNRVGRLGQAPCRVLGIHDAIGLPGRSCVDQITRE